MPAHRGPVSALALAHDEKSFFSAGWDGEALVSSVSSLQPLRTLFFVLFQHWDLNSGQVARKFSAHGAQLATVAVRPLNTSSIQSQWGAITPGSEFTVPMRGPRDDHSASYDPTSHRLNGQGFKQEDDAKSEGSYDPLFDEPDADGDGDGPKPPHSANHMSGFQQPNGQNLGRGAIAPKGAPPILDPATYASLSPDLLMTAHVDGQVILWDRRAQTPGKGVGRLWMSEKTPPWCMSVRPTFHHMGYSIESYTSM